MVLNTKIQPIKFKFFPLFLFLSISFLISGCADQPAGSESKAPLFSASSVSPIDTAGPVSSTINFSVPEGCVSFTATVVEIDHWSMMVEPDEGSAERSSSDRISVFLRNSCGTPPVPPEPKLFGMDGENLDPMDYLPGSRVEIIYHGSIMESYPAQISGCSQVWLLEEAPAPDQMMVDAYLAAIDAIWKEDDGLNNGITILAVDTSNLSDFGPAEKYCFLTALEKKYQLQIIEGTFDELREQGYIEKDYLNFPDGIFLSFQEPSYNKEAKRLTYGISKWRSGLGAIGTDRAVAEYDSSKWNVTHANLWIS